jgi:hypothetical protein
MKYNYLELYGTRHLFSNDLKIKPAAFSTQDSAVLI